MELGKLESAFDEVALTYSGDNVTNVVLYRNGNIIKETELVYSGDQVTDIYTSFPGQYLTEHIELSYTDDKITGINKTNEVIS